MGHSLIKFSEGDAVLELWETLKGFVAFDMSTDDESLTFMLTDKEEAQLLQVLTARAEQKSNVLGERQ